jgi:hypothetical protein
MSSREQVSARIRTLLSAGVLVVLGGCASAPSGHYRFTLGANDARTPSTWSLTSLPHHGRINLAAHTGEETNPQQSTHLILRFTDSGETFSVAALEMNDPGCQGAYSFSLAYSERSRLSETEYFDHKLPWAAPLNIRIEWWPDGRFEIEIADVGKRMLDWRGPAHAFEIRMFAGSLQVEDLDYQDLSSS